MSQKNITDAPIPMAKIPGLLRLPSGRYSLNISIPKVLRSQFGNKDTIRKALGTSERDEALSRFRVEALKVEIDFAAKRRKLKDATQAEEERRTLDAVPEEETLAMIYRWFIEMEKRQQSWWDIKGRKLDDVDLANPLDDLRIEEAAYMGGTNSVQATDCDATLALLLKSENIEPDSGPAFQKLSGMLQRAVLESLRRSMDRIERRPVSARENLFRDVFAHSPPPTIKNPVTLDELLNHCASMALAS